jgi:hypothetical protein
MDNPPVKDSDAHSGPFPSGADLADSAMGVVDMVVETLRDKTVRPLTLVARALVFGIIILAATLVTTVLVSVASVRLLTVYAFRGRVWPSDLVIGALFVIVGLVIWRKRTDPRFTAEESS